MAMPVRVVCCLFLLGLSLGASDAFRVLGVFPIRGHSHNIFFKQFMEVLAEKGHQVTMLSPFPQKKPKPNYIDVDLNYVVPNFTEQVTYELMSSPEMTSVYGTLVPINMLAGNDLCRVVFGTKEFKDVMSGVYGQFDVVFTEVFGSDCWAAVPYILKLPHIGLSSAPDVAWMHERIGSVDNPSYISSVFEEFVGRMNFLQRVQNTYAWFISQYYHKKWMEDGSDDVVREFLGPNIPPLTELIRNTSMVFINRHVSVHPARPVAPNVVHVGGLHIRAGPQSDPKAAVKELSADLRAWMDGAEHGVIFFSLGSVVPARSLPEKLQREILAAFAAVPQRVLWKFESSLSNLPANVRISKWLPQTAILAHPKTILFITHGGLMGTTESLFAGIPMLGLPLFADQGLNIEQYKAMGIAERLNHRTLSKDSLLSGVRRMTADNRYLSRAREVSLLYRDRPRSSAEEAVWWTEYVVRHGGAPHLRPLGADMPLYQYLLLDVVAAGLAAFAALVLGARLLVRALFTRQPEKVKTT